MASFRFYYDHAIVSLMMMISISSLQSNMFFVLGQQAIYGPSDNAAWPTTTTDLSGAVIGSKQELYNHFMKGCNEATNDTYTCKHGEDHRLLMNRLQPKSVRNFTKTGFLKIKAPENIFSLIKEFWENNRNKTEIEWKNINTYHNMWDAPPTFISIEDTSMIGGGKEIKEKVWKGAQRVLEEWTGQSLSGSSIYGIRLYHNNSILAPHVDRHPLVTSAIINVDQDVDEEWILEVYGHDGTATNVTMVPGDMVLYESHSVLHGRPFPMKGRFFANIFVHFEPSGALMDGSLPTDEDVLDSIHAGLPPYYIIGSEWENHWRQGNRDGWKMLQRYTQPGSYARKGNLEALKKIASDDARALKNRDHNGWGPIHEAARAGHVEVVKFLVENGVNINERSNHGTGHSPLHIALDALGRNHPVIEVIRSKGGVDIQAVSTKKNIATENDEDDDEDNDEEL